MKSSRSNFTSRIGFILSAAGSAVGLGNIWRFPYLAAQYGGGTFLLCYIILAVTFGFALMTAEIALGRKTGLSAIGAFSALNKRYRFVGVLVTLVPVIIFPYYSVIGGWVIKYFFTFLTGGVSAAAEDTYFTGFISGVSEPIVWFVIFTAIAAAVVICGVEKGIEKVSKVMMPLLVVLTVGISLYVLTIDGAMEGVKYYVLPHMSDFSIKTLLSSMGQLFYSMSLAMGIMITYGSYMSKSTNLESSVRQIEIFDTGIAFFAGLMIVPAVFAFSGGDPSALKAGPGLMFITLPKVFASIRFGGFLGTVFFVLVFFAAITSAISLMETIVSILMDFFHWSRRKTSILVFIYSLLMGVPSSLGFGIWDFVKPLGMSILDAWDFISNSILMPIVALLTCFFTGFVIKPKAIIEEACAEGADFKGKHLFTVVIKWVAPVILIAILISSILNALGIFVM
ncbi:sodium-dependent transporter [Schaedlerella arabinosiphila]|uniref:sodium-dependent transporter n=1 Tax=Schaedlerella arabinosiphila TaxID=2044587 RepID=UPI0025582F8E|nr:sodium-dependent transporter [Schaedlerella arabinosiphila]